MATVTCYAHHPHYRANMDCMYEWGLVDFLTITNFPALQRISLQRLNFYHKWQKCALFLIINIAGKKSHQDC